MPSLARSMFIRLNTKSMPYELKPKWLRSEQNRRKENSQGMGPKNPTHKQPGIGTQEPKNKQPRNGTQEPMKVWWMVDSRASVNVCPKGFGNSKLEQSDDATCRQGSKRKTAPRIRKETDLVENLRSDETV